MLICAKLYHEMVLKISFVGVSERENLNLKVVSGVKDNINGAGKKIGVPGQTLKSAFNIGYLKKLVVYVLTRKCFASKSVSNIVSLFELPSDGIKFSCA